jgi:hypothetical protein
MFTRIVSGGQTGVDRAALDVSLELGIPCGGWCPRGRKAEDGAIAAVYPLKETPTAEYAQRTEFNVRDSDGTLVLTRREPRGGTALTITIAGRLDKPCLVLDLDRQPRPLQARSWARDNEVRTLNVAGPRESDQPGIYEQAASWLREMLS